MTRELTSPTSDAAAALATQPGFLAQIAFSDFVRLSSRGTVAWSGNEWTGWDLKVSGLALDPGRPASAGVMVIGDHDLSMSALVLGEGLAGREISIWRYFAPAIADDDPVLVFDGVAGRVSGGRTRQVTVQLVARESTVLFAPRRYMTRETGFNALPAAGQVIPFNGEKYVLEPER